MGSHVITQAEASRIKGAFWPAGTQAPSAIPQSASPAATLSGRALIATGRLVRATVPVLRRTGTVCGWVLFSLTWWKVTRPGQTDHGFLCLTGAQIAGCLLGIFTAASFWILHNLRLGRSGRRQAPAYVPPIYEKDYLGRGLVLPSASALACASAITVRMESGKKVYDAENYEPELAEEMFEQVAQ
jgi:hypothetical protein